MMSFIQLLLLLRRLPFRDLLNYPDDLTDVTSVRVWLQAVVESGGVLAELTDTTIDDDIVDALKEVLDNKEAFDAVYSLVLSLFNNELSERNPVFKSRVYSVSDSVGFSPAIIIAIVQVVIMLLKFIRDRRN